MQHGFNVGGIRSVEHFCQTAPVKRIDDHSQLANISWQLDENSLCSCIWFIDNSKIGINLPVVLWICLVLDIPALQVAWLNTGIQQEHHIKQWSSLPTCCFVGCCLDCLLASLSALGSCPRVQNAWSHSVCHSSCRGRRHTLCDSSAWLLQCLQTLHLKNHGRSTRSRSCQVADF